MPSSAKKKLQSVAKSLKKSKTFVGIFSHLDKFVIKAKKFSFLLICKFNVVCFYVTRRTFEIFDPAGFLKTMKCLKSDILCKLASFAQDFGHVPQNNCQVWVRRISRIYYASLFETKEQSNGSVDHKTINRNRGQIFGYRRKGQANVCCRFATRTPDKFVQGSHN